MCGKAPAKVTEQKQNRFEQLPVLSCAQRAFWDLKLHPRIHLPAFLTTLLLHSLQPQPARSGRDPGVPKEPGAARPGPGPGAPARAPSADRKRKRAHGGGGDAARVGPAASFRFRQSGAGGEWRVPGPSAAPRAARPRPAHGPAQSEAAASGPHLRRWGGAGAPRQRRQQRAASGGTCPVLPCGAERPPGRRPAGPLGPRRPCLRPSGKDRMLVTVRDSVDVQVLLT